MSTLHTIILLVFSGLCSLWVFLLWLDIQLLRARLDGIHCRNLAELERFEEWIANSREMKIRNRLFGSIYWDGYTLLFGRKHGL